VPPRPALLLTDEEYAVREQDAGFQQHRAWEQNPVLTSKRHAQAAILGTIRCEACGFRFEQLYGDAGAGYIEYHYKTPFLEIDLAHEPQAHELALVCSNCHSMLHRMHAVLTVTELRQLVQRVAKGL
jgi:5-methylcytosine-specific restriction protein A